MPQHKLTEHCGCAACCSYVSAGIGQGFHSLAIHKPSGGKTRGGQSIEVASLELRVLSWVYLLTAMHKSVCENIYAALDEMVLYRSAA